MPGLRPEPEVGVVAHLDAAWVDDDELGSTLDDGAAHARCSDGVIGIGVGADYHEASGFFVINVGIGRGSASKSGQHRLNGR